MLGAEQPGSSAPQNANRTCRCSLMVSLLICSAISRIVAVPLPLSLIPGPCDDRVEVSADHHGLPLILPLGVGNDVLRRPTSG